MQEVSFTLTETELPKVKSIKSPEKNKKKNKNSEEVKEVIKNQEDEPQEDGSFLIFIISF